MVTRYFILVHREIKQNCTIAGKGPNNILFKCNCTKLTSLQMSIKLAMNNLYNKVDILSFNGTLIHDMSFSYHSKGLTAIRIFIKAQQEDVELIFLVRLQYAV